MWVISFGPKQNISQGQPVGFVSYLQSSALFASTVGMQKNQARTMSVQNFKWRAQTNRLLVRSTNIYES